MADNNTYVSKTNLDLFTRALKGKLDITYALKNHTHPIRDLTFTPNVDFLDWRMLPRATRTEPGVVIIGEGPESVASGDHTHVNASGVHDGMMSKEDYIKLSGLENYIHPTEDGYLHVPVTGNVSDGQVLTAGNAPGSIRWKPLPIVDVANPGLMPAELFVDVNTHIPDTTKHKTPNDNAVIASVGDALQLATEATQVVPAINELTNKILFNTTKIEQLQQNLSGMAGTLTALTAVAFNRMDPKSYVEGTICYVLDTTDLVINGKYYDGSPTSFIVVDPDGPGLQERQWVELSAMTPKMEAGAIKYYNATMANVNTVQDALDKIQANKLSRDGLVAGKVVIVGDDTSAINPLRCSNLDASVLENLQGLQVNVQYTLDNKSNVGHTHVCREITDLQAMTELDIEAAIEAAFQ